MYSQLDDQPSAITKEPQQPPEYTPQEQPPPAEGGYALQQPGYPPQQVYQPQQVYPSQSHSSATNTTVVIQQPPPQVVIQGPRDWSTGMCSCFDDCGVCLLGTFCPCALQCIVSSNAGECCCVGACCPIALRTKIRTRHNIQGSIMDDCCALYWCGLCALCQMAREINLQGM